MTDAQKIEILEFIAKSLMVMLAPTTEGSVLKTIELKQKPLIKTTGNITEENFATVVKNISKEIELTGRGVELLNELIRYNEGGPVIPAVIYLTLHEIFDASQKIKI